MNDNLILDDERTINQVFEVSGNNQIFTDNDWIIVRTYDEFVKFISNFGLPRMVSFDHDLGDFKDGSERTGLDACRYLVNYCINNNLDFPYYLVHSGNPRGAENIRSLIENFIDCRRNGFFE